MAPSSSSSESYSHDKPPLAPKKPSLDEATRQELRRRKLCFTCKESWEPGHRCLSIEVVSNNEEENEEDGQQSTGKAKENIDHIERISTLVCRGGAIAALTSTPECSVFRVRGTLQGQRVIVMLDSGATLNSINSSLVTRRGLHTEEHEGFEVKVARGNLLSCTHLVSQLSITMGNYTMTNDFFVIDLDDTDVILGIQWMETLD